ncbi:MAG: hypothetical protein MRY59_02260 [Aquisalinus sp.]|nr:hypothetical protein [Aquisalinus sp.]
MGSGNFIESVFLGDRAVLGADAGLWQNIVTEAGALVLGVGITAFLIDGLRKQAERKRWKAAEDNFLDRLASVVAEFSEDNFAPKSGPSRSIKRIVAEAKLADETIVDWAQASMLAFMLGGNRDFNTLKEVTETIQYIFNGMQNLSALETILKRTVGAEGGTGPDSAVTNMFHDEYGTRFQTLLASAEKVIVDFKNNTLNPEDLLTIQEYVHQITDTEEMERLAFKRAVR